MNIQWSPTKEKFIKTTTIEEELTPQNIRDKVRALQYEKERIEKRLPEIEKELSALSPQLKICEQLEAAEPAVEVVDVGREV